MKRSSAIGIIILSSLLVFVVLLISEQTFNASQSVRGKSPATPLNGEMTDEEQLAQDLALSNAQVQALTLGQQSEIFSIQKVGHQYTAASQACETATCYQVNIYNFEENATVMAIVDIDARQVRDVLHLPNSQPSPNQRLISLASQIVANSPEVAAQLGFAPSVAQIAPMHSGLTESACNDPHLCVAAAFHTDYDNITWVTVDLHEERVIQIDSHGIGAEVETSTASSPFVGCPPDGTVNQDGWAVNYETAPSDGFRVYNVTYNGVDVLADVKLAEWHADYGSEGFEDSVGCGGGGGGGYLIYPYGNTITNSLYISSTYVGFEVVQDFRMFSWGAPCNYRYEQHMQFFTDGRFRIVSGAFGKGCGLALYRPIVMIDMAINGDGIDNFALWNGASWDQQLTELYRTPYAGDDGPHNYTPEGYAWLVYDLLGDGYYIEPGQGQFNDGGRGDDPFLYVTTHHPNENDVDLPVVGDCCFNDHRQGPHTFVNSEPIKNTNIVLWYVPQMQTVNDPTTPDYYCYTLGDSSAPGPTYPCFAGPMFIPTQVDTGIIDHFVPAVSAP